MKDTEYGNIKVPMGLLLEVDKIIFDGSLGYASRNQFCVNGIRILKESYLNNNNYQPKKQQTSERKQ